MVSGSRFVADLERYFDMNRCCCWPIETIQDEGVLESKVRKLLAAFILTLQLLHSNSSDPSIRMLFHNDRLQIGWLVFIVAVLLTVLQRDKSGICAIFDMVGCRLSPAVFQEVKFQTPSGDFRESLFMGRSKYSIWGRALTFLVNCK